MTILTISTSKGLLTVTGQRIWLNQQQIGTYRWNETRKMYMITIGGVTTPADCIGLGVKCIVEKMK